MSIQSVCVNIDGPPKVHPLQVNEYPGPKGAYEMKKIENGYYLRVDMPGVSQPNLKVIRDIKHKEIRFQGFSKNIHEVLSIKDSNRFYVVAVKVQEGQDFDRVKVEHQIKNGTCRALITGLDHASLHFRSPPPKKPSDEGSSSSSSSSKDSKAPVHENPSATSSSHPYIALIGGITIRDRHSDDCTCCHGEKGRQTFNGPWSEEDGRIYGYVSPPEMGAFDTKFKAVGDGTGGYHMCFRMDMPDCSPDYKTDKCIHYIHEGRVLVEWHTDLTEFDDKFKLDSNGGRRYYIAEVTLPCGIQCCAFDYGVLGSKAALTDGVFRVYCKVKKRRPAPTVDPRLLHTERPRSKPSDDSGPCSTTSGSSSKRRAKKK